QGEVFYPSRRRHTRWPRDWSSDVCSSDLLHPGVDLVAEALTASPGRVVRWIMNSSPGARILTRSRPATASSSRVVGRRSRSPRRSEERRVGKECEARWWQYN